MKLEVTRATDLAIRALRAFEMHTEPIKSHDLAEIIGTTPAYVVKVMKPLHDAGWVRSERGPAGGYSLTAELSDHSLLELIDLVEGPVLNERCVLQGTPCPADEKCELHDAWAPAREALLDQLAKTPLAPSQKEKRS